MTRDHPEPKNFDSVVDEQMQRLRNIYVSEVPDKVARLRALVAELKEGKTHPSPVDEIFRAAHSMKGAAGMYGFQPMADLGEAVSDMLDPCRKGTKPATDEVCDLCDQWIAALIDIVESASKGVDRAAKDYAVYHRMKELMKGGASLR